ncbi:MAG: glutamine--fructose-6-phosphate transaminase (isomerizing) [Flavobacteriales bacterium]|jgi:glucosamine--fructose-6-phosphate aminotransferase (isomerizing)|nr:glutamine--fructose-6-phosphate transaminase (isomerizing) [Flavobacteriales bacterium]
MCGIVGYIGEKQALPILIKGLKRLEYRGYDSAGVAILSKDMTVEVYKKQGKVVNLENASKAYNKESLLGIGHTRWATHGVPSDTNSHPHQSNSGRLTMIHNGIIENYDSLKKELKTKGYTFKSETDTEVLINFIEDVMVHTETTLFEAVRRSLHHVIGAYAIAIIDEKNPDQVVVAKKGSPLAIGVGDGEFYIASDSSPFVEYTQDAIYLEDEQVALIDRHEGITLKTIQDEILSPYVQKVAFNLEAIEKGGYDFFMMKEIHEQPRSIHDTLRGRLLANEGTIKMRGIDEYEHKFLNAKRIIIVACGTSWHAGLVAEYLIEDMARIPVEVEYASEFRYRNPIINEDDIVVAISQSGETADTLSAIKLAKEKGATIFGICNVVGSSIAREAHAGAYTHAGPEIGVASTKAFTSQVAILSLIALHLGRLKGNLAEQEYFKLLHELDAIPEKIEKALLVNEQAIAISEKFKDAANFLYLGRGYSYPVALEGALKLKEISYIHAEGYPAAEMKHGPIALIDENMPTIVIANLEGHHEKVLSNIQEVKARNGQIIAVINEGDSAVKEIADYVIEVPQVSEPLSPLVNSVPLQLISYHIALMRGCNVDQPRNLAKSVTVE